MFFLSQNAAHDKDFMVIAFQSKTPQTLFTIYEGYHICNATQLTFSG